MWRCSSGGRSDGDPFEVLLDPLLLGRALDVHVLHAQGAAVGVAQDVEDLVQGGQVLAGQPVGHEGPRQVPDGQPVVQRVELGVELGRLGVEGVEMGDEVAAHPVHVDQRLDVDLLDQPEVVPLPLVVGRVDVVLPPRRLVGHLEGLEDLVVEAVLAHQALGHMGQEQTGLGPLDDPVVVGRGEGHRLADAQIGEGTGIGGLEPRREAEGPDADDQALPGHQPGYRLHGAQGPGIGQGHGGAGEVVGRDLVGVDLAHQLLVGPDEGAEIQGVGILDARHEERPGARRPSPRRRPDPGPRGGGGPPRACPSRRRRPRRRRSWPGRRPGP